MASSWFERHSTLTIAGLLLVGFLLLDVLFANGYKLIAGHAWGNGYLGIERSYRIGSPVFHHTLASNASVDNARWGPMTYRIRTNSLGFKDNAVRDVPLISDKHRIVFMGDSFTEGVGYEYGRTFVGLIDSALSHKGIEVLNAAVCGYSPIIYWRKSSYLVEELGLNFDELVVFPDVSDAIDETRRLLNDSGNVSEYSPKILPTSDDRIATKRDLDEGDRRIISTRLPKRLKEWLRNNTIVSFSAFKIGHRLLNIIRGEKGYAINERAAYWTIADKSNPPLREAGLPKIETYMDCLFDLMAAHGIRLSVVIFPNPDQVYYADTNSVWVAFWKDWCQRHDVLLLDCFPLLVRDQSLQDRERILDRYYLPGDFHFNENGNRLIANAFLDFHSAPSN